MVSIAILDYDAGNLHSAARGLTAAGAKVEIVTRPAALDQYDALVLPGDGAFDPAMEHLEKQGLIDPLLAAIRRGQPLLGICLGLQLLFDSSEEGSRGGLGVIRGRVKRFRPEPGLTIPHMGWNQLHWQRPCPLWQGLAPGTWAYFVHAYYGDPEDGDWIVATVTHGSQTVAAAVGRGTVWATQFHPEKSGALGLKILDNFVNFVRQSPGQQA
ncbi:MAG: imidazole glycerol phosphate synthase subunit HisH [Thermostichales cyanobacterium GMQP_bins_62]